MVTAAFRYYYLIIISSNYGPNHKGTKAQRTRKEIRGSLRLDDPCKAVSWPRPVLAPGCCPWPRPGLRRLSRRTGLPGGDWGAGGQAGQDHRFTRRRYRHEVLMMEGQLWATAPIRQVGPACTARVLGRGEAGACATWGRRTRWFGRRTGQLDCGQWKQRRTCARLRATHTWAEPLADYDFVRPGPDGGRLEER